MKAWLVYDFNKMKLEDVEMPIVRNGWVLIKIKIVQPSITEAMLFRGIDLARGELVEQKIKGKTAFQLFGHEFCGEVVDIGKGVNRIKVGDIVGNHSVAPCRKCEFCRSDRSELCNNKIIIGFTIPGAFAEYIVVPEELLISVPSNISASEAACIQPLSECVTEVYYSGINPADTVVIIGQGVMGLYAMAIIRYAGAGKVIAVDIRDETLKISKSFGADYVINPKKSDLIKTVLEITNGIGADLIFECSGLGCNIKNALEAVRKNGKIVCLSLIGGETPLPLADFRLKCVNLIFPQLTTFRMLEHTVFLLSNEFVNIKPLITHSLEGISKVPESFEITGNKAKYKAINSAQVIIN